MEKIIIGKKIIDQESEYELLSVIISTDLKQDLKQENLLSQE